jgi:hypothetical protein
MWDLWSKSFPLANLTLNMFNCALLKGLLWVQRPRARMCDDKQVVQVLKNWNICPQGPIILYCETVFYTAEISSNNRDDDAL